jgi:phosphoribosylamine--glycine ligase
MRDRSSLFVIGSGGREHSLVRHLSTHYPKTVIHCAPGNPGIARLATCRAVALTDLDGLLAAARDVAAGLTIVGPEAPLVAGLADRFAADGLPVLGPSARAAEIEGSKVYAKALMRRYGIPTAASASFDDAGAALAYLDGVASPVVVKADGLAAGKGVVMCDDVDDARRAVHALMVDGALGEAGQRVVVEERLDGDEASVFALVDGEAVTLLPAAQDHKRLRDGDLGPNTGGMGAVAPYPLPAALRRRIFTEILQPVAAAMCAEGRPYRGVLFAGVMLTRDGPKVLEFNCRLGDPEAQVILPLMAVGLPDAYADLRAGRLGWDTLLQGVEREAAAGVVLASRGYPGTPDVGLPLSGLEDAEDEALVFHSGTAEQNGRLVSAGGRVLTVVGRGATPNDARARAYRAAGRVRFDGMHYRRDIGARLSTASAPAGGR